MSEPQIQTSCEGCGATVTMPASQIGTVQECPQCGGYIDVPEITRVPTILDQQTERYELQAQETDRQLEVAKRQQEQNQHLLDRYDRIATRQDAIWDRAGELLDRCQALADRFERVLSKMEHQSATEPGAAVNRPRD